MNSLGLSAGAVACLAFTAGTAYAGGFELRSFDAKATGMSQAFTAVADNAAAASYNPAGMSQLDGIQASATVGIIKPYIHFEADNPAEGEANNVSEASVVPALNASIEVPGTDFLHIGLGINAPYGTNVRWRDQWPGRYIAIHTKIETLEADPSIAFKVPGLPEGTTLSLSAGFGVMRTQVKLKQAIDFSAAGSPDAYARLHGNTDHHLRLRWDAGIHATFMDRMIRVGAFFKSATQNNVIHGRGEFWNQPINPITGQPALPGATRVRTELNVPDQLKMGVAVAPIEGLLVSAEFTWTNWSRLHNVTIEFPDLGRNSIIPLNWRDTYYYALGAEYAVVKDTFFVRAGIFYDESPTRVSTFSPSIPDNHRDGFSVGVGFNPIESVQLDAAYALVLLHDFHKMNEIGKTSVLGGQPSADGDFETFAHTFSFTVGVWF